MSESSFGAELDDLLRKCGIMTATLNETRRRPRGTRTTPGVPDRLLIAGGECHIWELKDLGGRLTDSETKFHADALEHGYWIPVIRSIDEALHWLDVQFGKVAR